MTSCCVFGELEFNVAAAGATFVVVQQFETAGVRNKICLPDIARELEPLVVAGVQNTLAVEITLPRVEAVGKGEIVVENEIQVMQQIDHCRRGGDGEVTRRLAAAAVEKLVPSIERR